MKVYLIYYLNFIITTNLSDLCHQKLRKYAECVLEKVYFFQIRIATATLGAIRNKQWTQARRSSFTTTLHNIAMEQINRNARIGAPQYSLRRPQPAVGLCIRCRSDRK